MKRQINTYLDGATVRLPNKRISFKETDKVEKELLELIATKDRMEEMTGEDEDHQIHYNLDKTNKEYQTLYKRWRNLIDIIKNYYKKKLTTTFEIKGEEATRQLHKEIVQNLKRNEQYEIRTGVIWFDITDFTRNLIKKA